MQYILNNSSNLYGILNLMWHNCSLYLTFSIGKYPKYFMYKKTVLINFGSIYTIQCVVNATQSLYIDIADTIFFLLQLIANIVSLWGLNVRLKKSTIY